MRCNPERVVALNPEGVSPSSPGLPYSATLGTDAGCVATLKGLWPSSSAIRNTHGEAMPQSLSAVYIHLVFSTKERQPFLRDRDTRESLHAYLGGISKTLDCPPIIVGGIEDHVHLLARFGRTITQAGWVKELKRVSNLWLKEQNRLYADFQWQGGYADFSVSPSNLERVKKYIANQEDNHRKLSFQDELRALLRKHKVEWDERYVWD
jgi:putative transposase